LTRILQHQTPDLPDVRPLGFTGYCREAKAYVFGQLAVANGRVFRPNDDDFFQIGKQAIKLGTSERLLDIEYDADRLDTSWLADLWTAYGAKGLVCLSFFFGSLFAEQVRTEMKSFPFLEMHGLPGTGKTTLVEFLWKLLGRENYEGFDPAKATPAAMARNLGKVGNLPVVLIEGDRREEASHARKFEWEELKTAYNGRTVRARGVRNGGMETFEPPFRGAIVIEQNEPVNARPGRARTHHVARLRHDGLVGPDQGLGRAASSGRSRPSRASSSTPPGARTRSWPASGRPLPSTRRSCSPCRASAPTASPRPTGSCSPSSMRCARCSRSPTNSRPPRPSSSSTWRPSGNWP
jgi:hypothetical protein